MTEMSERYMQNLKNKDSTSEKVSTFFCHLYLEVEILVLVHVFAMTHLQY